MRRVWKLALAAVGVPLVGAAVLAAPPTGELMIALTCRSAPQTQNCITRMRAMGHVWVYWGAFDRAICWYGRAAEEGDDTESFFHLGWAYEQRGYRHLAPRIQALERAVEVASSRAHTKIQADAEAGRPLDLPAMPVDLPTGREDFDRAASAYRKAADRGFAPAMNNLGTMYVSGLFGSATRGDGAQWIIRAARAGNPFGAVNATLLYFYWSGMGVRPDSAEARTWSEWNGEDVNPKDLAYPTLEHTSMVLRSGLEPRLFWTIREAAKRRIPLGVDFTPLHPDPRLPTFSPVIKHLN